MSDKPLTANITCHAFNKDGTAIALSPNSNEIFIYETKGDHDFHKWEKKHVLTEHAGHVCSIDWCHSTNQIVTCGHDRNAYVWTYKEDSHKWEPELVILRINRAATQVKWSPQGNKFAVTSGMKSVPVCNYDPANRWWVSKMIKKHKSTVLSVAWSPSNKLIVTGSSDNKCRIFSAYLNKIDSDAEDSLTAIFPDQHKFGELLAEFDQAKAWVHSVAWSPSGNRIAFAGHGSTLHFVQLGSGGAHNVHPVFLKGLPFLDIKYMSEVCLIGVGYDYNPTVFHSASETETAWEYCDVLDKGDKVQKKATSDSLFANARTRFMESTDKGLQADQKVHETILTTKHQNTICNFWIHSPKLISTAALDGHIYFWDLGASTLDLASLKLQ